MVAEDDRGVLQGCQFDARGHETAMLFVLIHVYTIVVQNCPCIHIINPPTYMMCAAEEGLTEVRGKHALSYDREKRL